MNNTSLTRVKSGQAYLLSSSHVGSEEVAIRIYDGNNNVVFNEKKTFKGGMVLLFNRKDVLGLPSFEVSDTLAIP